MVKVFVHGVPETEVIWGPLIAALEDRFVDDRMIRLSPPGFGATVPEGWVASPSAYVDWLEARLVEIIDSEAAAARFPEIDLVGHDWGAGHVMGLVAKRPDLVRTWAVDCAALLNPDYVWHDTAQQWQTPEVGESVIEFMTSIAASDRAATYIELGLGPEAAASMAEALNTKMGECILDLYRAAAQPAVAEMGARLFAVLDGLGPDAPSGLVVDPMQDPYVPSQLAQPVIERLGAERAVLPDDGHWWMVSPSAVSVVADALLMFWRTHGTA